ERADKSTPRRQPTIEAITPTPADVRVPIGVKIGEMDRLVILRRPPASCITKLGCPHGIVHKGRPDTGRADQTSHTPAAHIRLAIAVNVSELNRAPVRRIRIPHDLEGYEPNFGCPKKFML